MSGIVADSNGAIIPEAELKLYKKGDKKSFKVKSGDDGNYSFKNISAGNYTLEVKYQGFMTRKFVNLDVKSGEKIEINVELQPSQKSVMVGIFASESLIDTTSSSLTTKFTRKQIENLPY